MAEYTALKPLFSDIANAIREKDGSTGTIPAETFPDRIRGIPSATDLTQQPAKVWTPSTQDQIIPAETYLTGDQTIKGDANLIASNIKEGVSIFGIIGNASGGGQPVTITFKNNSDFDYWNIFYSNGTEAETLNKSGSNISFTINCYPGLLLIEFQRYTNNGKSYLDPVITSSNNSVYTNTGIGHSIFLSGTASLGSMGEMEQAMAYGIIGNSGGSCTVTVTDTPH